MQIIQNIDGKTFKLNGVKFIKIFTIIKNGTTNISIHNSYDTKQQILSSTHFSQISVDGVVHTSANALIDALVIILFAKNAGLDNYKEVVVLNGQPDGTIILEGQNNGTTTFVLDKEGNIIANGFQVYGGLNSQFLKADGSTDSTSYLPSSKINGTSGKIPKFDNNGGVVNSQIEDSANHVIIGGNGTYTEKLEVNGNVKANSFVGNATSATKLNTTRTINGVAFDGTANITIPAADITPRIATSEKGAANGVATLDANALIPSTQLPSYVDDVLEYANLSSFPAIGTTGKIYVAIDTNKTYRWSGSVYVFITSGAVDSVAGKTGVVTLAKGDVGLSNVDNTSDASKSISTATQNALNLKANLASPTFTGNVSGISKAMVGLSNVDNTADSTKSVNYAGTAGSATNANYALNAGLLLNNAPSSTGGANTIVQRDSNGYISNNYFATTTGGAERNASGMFYFAGFNSSDTYIRSYTPAAVAATISGQIMNINGNSNYSTTANYANSAGSASANDVYAWAKASSKPNYVKSEVGLGNVDNTSDASKSVNYANLSGQVSIGYNQTAVNNFKVLFGNGNTVQATTNVWCNPAFGSITASGFYSESDIRFKNVIHQEYNNIDQISRISYTWKDETKGNLTQVGYSAQDVQKYIPDAVTADENGYLSVNYIQVLVAKVEALEKRIKQLENGI